MYRSPSRCQAFNLLTGIKNTYAVGGSRCSKYELLCTSLRFYTSRILYSRRLTADRAPYCIDIEWDTGGSSVIEQPCRNPFV